MYLAGADHVLGTEDTTGRSHHHPCSLPLRSATMEAGRAGPARVRIRAERGFPNLCQIANKFLVAWPFLAPPPWTSNAVSVIVMGTLIVPSTPRTAWHHGCTAWPGAHAQPPSHLGGRPEKANMAGYWH